MSILVDQQKAKSITIDKYKKLTIHSSINGEEKKLLNLHETNNIDLEHTNKIWRNSGGNKQIDNCSRFKHDSCIR